MRLYREFTTQEEIDAVYNPAATAPDADAVIQSWFDRSAAAVAALEGRLGVKYGPTREEYCDVFPAGPDAPVHVFIHGGYWRRFSARDHAFVARPLVAAGITTVVVNYALCPRVTLDEIVREVRASIAWTFAHAEDFGADPERLTISGHSAGGHLVAMALLTDWKGDYDLPRTIIKGAVAISGLYDLGFLPWSYVQPKVQATWDQVARLSPLHHLPREAPPLVVAVGAQETAEFRRQSRDFHAAWTAKGLPGSYLEPAGRDHFTVLDELERPEGELFSVLVQLARGSA
ncbi:alpha/beta hydrolase [Benzoatithermus flavus]|uniref:Alpha/beta hydrolase n=1 Tax=Benzoatithermus flavus TaxID=3108223 RepID=A0ABU8XWI9_9PROT